MTNYIEWTPTSYGEEVEAFKRLMSHVDDTYVGPYIEEPPLSDYDHYADDFVSGECTPVSNKGSLPDDPTLRNEYPMADGLLDYFPNALAEVSKLSFVATQQHHPDQPMHWDRNKSTDHANKIMRHLVDRGKLDDKGMRHSAMVAWRALALLQDELETAGAPMSRASRTT